MSDTNKEDQSTSSESEKIIPLARSVPPHALDLAPVELHEPVEDEVQVYTGHAPADESVTGVSPAVARGTTPVPPDAD